ncbi:RNA methyltransferase, RsmD family [Chlamydia ibidis]|uniref:RNA methyltransferase, RsmD family n=2 Tax=Chlamydia ibidis TaxID=1405396 RepID=S7KJM2_9CHLA|nr:16S rRNA (guanine(966)-N(2))-methyltransferase RsmD [Chlamydia ibidis]EPP34625.1 RNA methyltransferase, RsmD family [Chlamydia ibidis]EQM62921.1 RNA methyltransferase, RsmD family [Chlamydia ibidis 10-1398/6]
MKILAGKYKGKSFKTFTNHAVRPTCGIVKEAVFNICASYLDNSSFLDLFAGIGSMGLEALSRGAASVTFVDNSPQAVRLIRANCDLLSTDLPVFIIKQDVRSAVQRLAKKGFSFDLIYVDPPYNLDNNYISSILSDIVSGKLLDDQGMLFLENASVDPIEVAGLYLKNRRKLGGTFLSEYLSCCSQELN